MNVARSVNRSCSVTKAACLKAFVSQLSGALNTLKWMLVAIVAASDQIASFNEAGSEINTLIIISGARMLVDVRYVFVAQSSRFNRTPWGTHMCTAT